MHPRMDTALEQVYPLRQVGYLDRAALNDPGLRHGDRRKAADTFRHRGFARRIQWREETSTELLDLGEGMRP